MICLKRNERETKMSRNKHPKSLKGTQPFVDPRLRTRSEIETLRRSPRGQLGKGKYPPQGKEDKFEQTKKNI